MVKKQSGTLYTCRPVTKVFLRISCKYYAGTTGKIRYGFKQGDIECETKHDTFDGINSRCNRFERDSDLKCGALFDTRKPISIQVISDSMDDAYLQEVAAMIGGRVIHFKVWDLKVNRKNPSPWRTIQPQHPDDVAWHMGNNGGRPKYWKE